MTEQAYYFTVEKRDDNALTFAYIWRKGENANTNPPAKSFHSLRGGEEGFRRVSKKAVKWIYANGEFIRNDDNTEAD